MSDVIAMDGFEGLLRGVLRERVGVEARRGFEQRMLARLAQEDAPVVAVMPQRFAFVEAVGVRRGSRSAWFAVGAHALALLVVIAVASMSRTMVTKPMAVASVDLSAPPVPMPKRLEAAGGGGGRHDAAPVTAGHLPKFAETQIVAPKAPPTVAPKLAVEASVVVQPDLKLADNSMANMGSPTSTLKGFSMGNGSGSGMGNGNGGGIGPGVGGNTGGGLYHVGGGVIAPVLIASVDPEYSEQARKAKFDGNVEVYLIVDEKGNPTHVSVARGVGMGLDEKAIEAVRQYKFKPAMKDGKPVKVDMYVDVTYQIF